MGEVKKHISGKGVETGKELGRLEEEKVVAESGQEAEIVKQEEIATKQQTLIDEEKAKQQKVKDERKRRMKGFTLLSGSETGTATSLDLLK